MTFDDRPLNPDWAQCRGANHWLEWIPHPLDARANGIIPVWWRCIHCTTERRDELDASTLELVGRRYLYPDGYVQKGDGRATRATWRATYLRAIGAINQQQAARARRYRKQLGET